MKSFKQILNEINDNEAPKSHEEWAKIRDEHLATAKRHAEKADKMVDSGHSLEHPMVQRIIGLQRQAEDKAAKAHWEHRKALLSGKKV